MQGVSNNAEKESQDEILENDDDRSRKLAHPRKFEEDDDSDDDPVIYEKVTHCNCHNCRINIYVNFIEGVDDKFLSPTLFHSWRHFSRDNFQIIKAVRRVRKDDYSDNEEDPDSDDEPVQYEKVRHYNCYNINLYVNVI